MTVLPMIGTPIAWCIHPVMVMSTNQGRVPFAPFASCGDTLELYCCCSHYVHLVLYRSVVWCVCVVWEIYTAARNPS